MSDADAGRPRPSIFRGVWLFVPGNQPRRFAKAVTSGADIVILDLEDAIATGEKATARQAVAEALVGDDLWEAPTSICVRINGMATPWWTEDLSAIVRPGLSAIMVPKAEDLWDFARLDEKLTGLEQMVGLPPGIVRVVPLVESASGVLAVPMLAKAPRVEALAFGALDYIQDVAGRLTPERTEVLFARSQVVLAARAARVAPIDAVYPELENDAGLETEATVGRNLGFAGKMVIHPRQIGPVRRAFTPTEAEIAYAREVTEAFALASSRGEAAIRVRGKFVDRPIVLWSQSILTDPER